jgi:hypothetical protein
MTYILAHLVLLDDFFFFLFSFAITGRVKRITQPIFIPDKKECQELINLKQAFPPLKRSVSHHQPPPTSFNSCKIL